MVRMMNEFVQLIRVKNSEVHKERIYSYVDNLNIKDDSEYECIVRKYKESKTDEQRGYYFSTVVVVALKWQGLTFDQAHQWLKEQCAEKVYFSTLDGESHIFTPSIAKMKIDVMSRYIDTCINFMGAQGQYVPPPKWVNK